VTGGKIITTEVKDHDERGILAFDLVEIILFLSPLLGDVEWHVVELEARGRGRINILDLEAQIESNPNGLKIGTEELIRIASDFFQVIDIILVVPKPGVPMPRLPTNSKYYESTRLVLFCIDTSVWGVTTDEEAIHDLIRSKYKVVTSVV
jgi:hypothetical protein